MSGIGAINPIEEAAAWTVLKASGKPSPGKILAGGVSGFKREEKWDVKEGKGTTGATTTRVGLVPAKGTVKITLWKAEHYKAWDPWLAIWKFDATKKTGQAVDAFFPSFISVQPPIVSLVMTGHTPVIPDAEGRADVELELLEYFPAKATGATTAKGATQYVNAGNDPSGSNDPAVKQMQKQSQQLLKQLQASGA